MKTFTQLLAANAKQFFRERAALFWTFVFPIFFILIFGAVFSGEDDLSFSVGLVIEDNSSVAQELSAVLQQVPAFELQVGEFDTEMGALEDGDRRVVIVVESGFGESIAQGAKGNIDVYYDPTQTTSAQVLLPIVYQVIDEFDRMLGQAPSLVQLNEKTLQTYNLRAIDYLVPGILAMALMQLGLFAVAPLVADREKGVLKRLGATPLRRSTIIFSMVVFNMFVAMMQAALIIIVARLVFDVPMLGNWFYLIGFVMLGTLTFLALGYMISSFARTEQTLMPLLMIVQFPMMFL
ncbi:MAG: ABC transporter permease, partial [Chloroflexota bacterium]|nr:ABC transporter permease [Chloroflexota bacterium]